MGNNNKREGSYKYMYLMTAGICVAVAAMLIFFVLALSRFAGRKETSESVSEAESSEAESSVVISEPSEETSEASKYKYLDSIQREDCIFNNTDVVNGNLAVVDSKTGYPSVSQSDLVRISDKKTPDLYGLSNTSLFINEAAMKPFDSFIVSFANTTPKSGIIIAGGYIKPESAKDAKTAELTTSYSVKLGIYNSPYKFSDTEFSYLKEQCYKFGIIRRFPDGKETYTGQESDNSIYRYVGLAHSLYMNHYNYSLEEYIDKIHTDKVIEYESELEADTAYVIYYVPAESGETTSIPVPVDSERHPYEISGDGSGGFIVTVKVKI